MNREKMLVLAEGNTPTDHEFMPVLHMLVKGVWPGYDAAVVKLRDSGERWGLLKATLAALEKRGWIKVAGGSPYGKGQGSISITPAGKKWYKAQSWWS